MIKILKIKYCAECCHVKPLGNGFECIKTGKALKMDSTWGNPNGDIPEWCPLENEKSPNINCFYHGGKGCNNINLNVKTKVE